MQASFNAPYQALQDYKADLSQAKTKLRAALADWDARYHSPDGAASCFRPAEVTPAQLRQWVAEVVEPRFTRPFGMLFIGAEYLRDNIGFYLSALTPLMTSLQSKLTGLVQGPDSLGDITNSLKDVIQKLKDFNLGFLRDSLKDLFAQVRAKFDAISPTHLRKIIEEQFDELLKEVNVGQIISPADVKKLDGDYEKIINKLKALDPGKVVIEVVQPEFEKKIVPLLDAFDLTIVLTALIDKLHALSGELKKELDKVNDAYKALRKAVPSMSLSLDIDIDIDIGSPF
jgi:hypothetical protein